MIIAASANSVVKLRQHMIAAMQAKGHEVVVAATPEEGWHTDIPKMGCKYVPLQLQNTGLNPVRDIRAFFHLYWAIRQERPDKILCYTIKPVVYGTIAAFFARVPERYAMITGLGYAFLPKKGLKSWLLKIAASVLYWTALRFCMRVFFQNPDDLDLFCKKHFVKPDKTVLINGSGIPLDEYPLQPIPDMSNGIIFLLVARLLRDKGIVEYVEASRLVKQKYPATRCLLLGPYYDNPAGLSHEIVEGWIDEGAIEYLGETKDIRPYMVDCHVCVLPSYREGTSRVLLEAMATGRPLLTTNAPGCRDTVLEGENGYTVPVQDAQSLADRMLWFLDNSDRIEAMGLASRDYAEEKYDVKKVNQVIMNTMNLNLNG